MNKNQRQESRKRTRSSVCWQGRAGVYWVNKQTNNNETKQTNRQPSRQTNGRKAGKAEKQPKKEGARPNRPTTQPFSYPTNPPDQMAKWNFNFFPAFSAYLLLIPPSRWGPWAGSVAIMHGKSFRHFPVHKHVIWLDFLAAAGHLLYWLPCPPAERKPQ